MAKKEPYSNTPTEVIPVQYEIDGKDSKILQALKEDASLSIREIAKNTNLRPSTVHQRIQKLVKNNVIEKYTIKTNDVVLDESLLVVFLIKGSTQKYLTSRIIQDDRVKEVLGITGEYDLLIKAKFSNVNEFNEYIIDFRKKHPQITSTLTMVGTAKLKEEL